LTVHVRTMSRRRHQWCLLLLPIAVDAAAAAASPTAPTEYEVKEAFIYNFAQYVQWPESPRIDPKRSFIIGLIGKDAFGPALDEVVSGQSIQGRPVRVTRFRRVEDIAGCDILFVAASERGNLTKIFAALNKAPVLTIGDMDHFAQLGGMINLINEGNRIRFEINVAAIERAGLKAGSQLLRLARIVSESQSGSR